MKLVKKMPYFWPKPVSSNGILNQYSYKRVLKNLDLRGGKKRSPPKKSKSDFLVKMTIEMKILTKNGLLTSKMSAQRYISTAQFI